MTTNTSALWRAAIVVLVAGAGFSACTPSDEFSGTPDYEWDYEIRVEPDSVTGTLQAPFVLSFLSTFDGEVAPEMDASLEYPAFLEDPTFVVEEGLDLWVTHPGSAGVGDPLLYSFIPVLGEPSRHDLEFRCREAGTGESINARFVLPYHADGADLDVPVVCSDAVASLDRRVILSGSRAGPFAHGAAP